MLQVLTMSRDIINSFITCIRTFKETDHSCRTERVSEFTTIDYSRFKMLSQVILGVGKTCMLTLLLWWIQTHMIP